MNSRFKAYESNFRDPPKDLPTDDYHFHTKKDTSIHQGCLSYIILRAWGKMSWYHLSNVFICLNY